MQALSTETVVAIVGAGAMGAGIAQVAAAAGHRVRLFDVAPDAVSKGLAGLSAGLHKQVAREKMNRQQADAILARIIPADSLEQLSDAGLVIEAVVENLEIKQNIFTSLEALCSAETIFASNTSSLSITSLGAKLENPNRLVGMHFFNPPQAMKLVEVIDGLATDNTITETIIETARQWGKKPVRTKSTPGFIVNRVARPYYAEALRMLQDGIGDCKTIDQALTGSGKFRMGPFTLMDLIGLDVNYAVTESVFKAYFYDSRFKPSAIQRELVGGGFLGRKSGRGFYDYSSDLEPAHYLPEADQPSQLTIVGNPVGVDDLLARCESTDINITKQSSNEDNTEQDYLEVSGTRFAITDGRTATERSRDSGHKHWVLVDLINDIEHCTSVSLACSDLSDVNALASVAGFFQRLNKNVIRVDDTPAMVVMRTVCMLVNEAADAVKEGGCTASAVDTAMQLGTNYPRGPLEWGESIGLQNVLTVLQHLHRWYGEDRYRSSVLLQRLVLSGGRFHES
jgi:3-hydroxybutyryl-CoA dehydrogenase